MEYDEDNTILQTEEDKKRLRREIFGDTSGADQEDDTTLHD